MIECANCGHPFDAVGTRWLCPNCGWKESCCEGEALACPTAVPVPVPRPTDAAGR